MYNLSLRNIADMVQSFQRFWHANCADSTPGWAADVIDGMGYDLSEAVPFVLASEPADQGEWDGVLASAGDMAELDLLHLPYPVIYFEFNMFGPEEGPKMAAVVRESDEIWQIICYAKYSDWGVHTLMINMERTGDFSAGIAASIADLQTGKDLEFDSEGTFSYSEDNSATFGQLGTAVFLRVCFLALWLVVALTTEGVKQERVPAPHKLNAKRVAQDRAELPGYTIIRVPQQSGHSSKGGSGSPKRMHLRRSHIWGRIKRAREQWQFRPACLVNGRAGGPLVRPVYDVRANLKKAA